VGDVGYLDDEGYLYLTDRRHHMIISGRVNIYPQETEDALVSHPLVRIASDEITALAPLSPIM
jgi:long-chain acyl-CoA synthetase